MNRCILPNAVCLDHAPTLQIWYSKLSTRRTKANIPRKEDKSTREAANERALEHEDVGQQNPPTPHQSVHDNQDADIAMDFGGIPFFTCKVYGYNV